MKLDHKKRQILYGCLNRELQPVEELAKSLPYKSHSIRRELNKLLEQKVLIPFAVINPGRIGLTMYNFLFSIQLEDSAKIPVILGEIRSYPGVQWLALITGGDFGFEFTIQAKSLFEVELFFRKLGEQHKCQFFNKVLSLEYSQAYLGEKFIYPSGERELPMPILQIENAGPVIDIDEDDHRILAALAKGEDPTTTSLARRLKLPSTTVKYRKDKLKERGVIVSEIYRLNPAIVERYINIALIYVGDYSVNFFKKFLAVCSAHPNIVACHRCIGSWDCKLLIEAETSRELAGVIEQLERFLSPFRGRCRTYQILKIWENKLN